MADDGGNEKNFWEKLDVVMKPLGGLFTAIAVALVGYFAQDIIQEQQAADARVRLYSELMSQREQSESALRKDMFGTIIQSFVGTQAATLDTRVLNLELLAYNFHDTLNLKPLFLHLAKRVQASNDPERMEYMQRLTRVAREVIRKQTMVLESAGAKYDRVIDFEQLAASPGGLALEPAVLSVKGESPRKFQLYALRVDESTGQIKMRLEITTPDGSASDGDASVTEFWVGPFDFPMIDNTRLLRDQRCAIVLNNFNSAGADLTLIYFPGSYASLKERPYFQEVVDELLGEQMEAQ